MKPPETYEQWSACLDALMTGRDLELVIMALERGHLSWSSGVAEPFARRMNEVFNARLQVLSERLERELRRGSDETTIVRALTDARRTLALLHRIATAPPFPDTLRLHLTTELQSFAARAQQTLEDSARADRRGHLSHLIRHHSLQNYESANPLTRNTDAVVEAGLAPPPQAGRRRTILR